MAKLADVRKKASLTQSGLAALASVRNTKICGIESGKILSAFADQASLALEKARLLNEAETRERQATQLYEVTTQLASNHDLASVLDLIVQKASELLDSEASSLFSYDGGKAA